VPGNIRETFGSVMGRASRLWRAKLDERLGPLGLTQAKWLILVHLSRAGGAMPQKELVESVGVEGPTVVRVLDGLERLGLVERCGQHADRRTKTVHLTSQAAAMLEEILLIAAGLREEVLAGVSEEDLAVCNRVVTAMLRNMGVSPLFLG
jgi:MarR family transcriptional regulator, transcriptional regulator for hemolysin